MADLLRFARHGIECPEGGFFIDPWRPVERAVITHAHADHARSGHTHYLCHRLTAPVLRARLGSELSIQSVEYNEPLQLNGVRITLHPSGHLPGAAQIAVEKNGDKWVATGDYKTAPDGFSEPWQPVPCRVLITESTFALPIYRWPPAAEVYAEIDAWRRENATRGAVSVLTAYSLGKAQRLLSALNPEVGPIFVHPAIEQMNAVFREAGLPLGNFPVFRADTPVSELRGCLLLTPPSAADNLYPKKTEDISTAHASGWMRLRGSRRRLALDRGFVVSDHADWPGLNLAIQETGAERVIAAHGYTEPLVRWLREKGLQAEAASTRFRFESTDEEAKTE